ncbi:MAG: UDP-N-acetylmuramoyl-L-alanine--D-glutamate ligase, partial [Hominisplanchenecus sp.]
MELKNKNVLVFGTGLSGIGAAKLLYRMGAIPVLYDGNPDVDPDAVREKLGEEKMRILTGELPSEVMDRLELAVLSPGVPTDLPIVMAMKERGILLWGEVELAYEYSKGDVLAITGTNGKTTTTSLLGEIMRHHKDSVFVVGNIGTPYTGAASATTEESVTVAEISSFQLETIDTFHPKVSAILNITPDHLNRHHTMEEYIRVKERITANQTEDDTCVLNYEDEVLREFGKTLRCRVLFFSSLRTLEKGVYLDHDRITYSDGKEKTVICSTKELNLPGRHNHENVMAAA